MKSLAFFFICVVFLAFGCTVSDNHSESNKQSVDYGGLKERNETNDDNVIHNDNGTSKSDNKCNKIDYVELAKGDMWMKENSEIIISEMKKKFDHEKGYEIVSNIDELKWYCDLKLIPDNLLNEFDFIKNDMIAVRADESGIVSGDLYIKSACLNETVKIVQERCTVDNAYGAVGSTSMSWPYLFIQIPKGSYQDVSFENNTIKCDE